MKRAIIAAALVTGLCAVRTCGAAELNKPERAKPAPVFETTPIRNLLIEFRLEYRGQVVLHRLLAQEGTQNNYAVKEASGTSVIITSLPTAYPNTPGVYAVQFQFEYRNEKGANVQLSNEVIVREARETAVLDDPETRITLKVASKEVE